AWISDFRSGSGGGELRSFQVTNNSHIIFLDLNLTKSGTVWVYVVSDYSLDILVMDRGNFTSYYATEQGNLTQWGAYATKVNVTAGGLNYTAPIDGYYLFIIDNTPLNAGGAPGDRTANFSVSYAYQWNHYPAPLSWLQGN
ncbi:MAG TPA: hypothetical protein VGJ92_08935, partial [Methanocella sp.]